MIRSYKRGHSIIYIGRWVYADTRTPVTVERACVRCKRMPSNGMDACMGRLPGVTSACCGHGVEKKYKRLRGVGPGKIAAL